MILSKKEINFNSNPKNLKEFFTVQNAFSNSGDNQFVIIKIYLIFISKKKFNLECFNLESFSIIKEYENVHLKTIRLIKYYIKENKHLIITTSKENSLKIFDFNENDQNIQCLIHIKNVGDVPFDENNNFLLDSVLILTIENKDLIITNNFDDKYLKIFDFEGKNLNKKFCEHSHKGKTFYIQYYQKQNKNYIIKHSSINLYSSIISYNFETGKKYHSYGKEIYANNCIIKEINSKDCIIFGDRFKKNYCVYDFNEENILLNIIKLEYDPICILFWNDEFVISGTDHNNIQIINVVNKEIKIINGNHKNLVFSLGKVKIKEKEFFLSQEVNGNIKIWK